MKFTIIRKVLISLKVKKIIETFSPPQEKEKKIIFHTIRFNRLLTEGILASYLAKQGHNVTVILDDYTLNHWDADSPIAKNFKAKAFNKLIQLCFLSKRVNVLYYSQIPEQKDKDNGQNNIDINYHALASTIRYFKTTEIDLTDPYQNEYYLQSLENAYKSLNTARFIEKNLKPDLVVHNLGIYSNLGPSAEYLKNRGTPIKIYCRACYIDNRLIIDDIKTQILSTSKKWLDYLSKEQPAAEKAAAIEFLQKRINFQTNDTQVYYNKVHADMKRFESLEGHIFCAFPNISWDGHDRDRNVYFAGVVDWLSEIIEFFKNRPKMNLIIKYHPGESTFFKQSKKMSEIIYAKHPDIEECNNIQIINSEDSIDTYLLIKEIVDVSLVYDSIVGLESYYLETPCLHGAKGYLAFEDISGLKIKNKADFFEKLENPEELIKKFNQNKEDILLRLNKYIYWYIFKNTYYFPTAAKLAQRFFDIPAKELNSNVFSFDYVGDTLKEIQRT